MSFKDMPLDTTLQKGDVVTITGPGEHDVLVREVMGVNEHIGPFVSDTASTTMRLAHLTSGLGRTLTRVQRPVPALPTVEGSYILTHPDGSRALRVLADGSWRIGTGGRADMDNLLRGLQSGAILTRVIPADEVKRPEVDVEAATSGVDIAAAREAFAATYSSSIDCPDDDFEATLRRVIEGEFDL